MVNDCAVTKKLSNLEKIKNVAKAQLNCTLTVPSATRLPDGQEADGNKITTEPILLPFTSVNSLPRLIGGFVDWRYARGFNPIAICLSISIMT